MAKDVDVQGRMLAAISATQGKVRADRPDDGAYFNIRRIDAGKIVLPTGRICVTDAYSADQFPPLNRIVPSGDYPVELVVAELPRGLSYGGDRCAFIVVTFGDVKTCSWEPITAVAPADPCFTDDNPNRIVQEGATGLFSPEAGEIHYRQLWQQFDQQVEILRERGNRFGHNRWINYQPGPDAPNVIICEGGIGDGNYECFVGLNRLGRVARLVIDFQIADPIDVVTVPVT